MNFYALEIFIRIRTAQFTVSSTHFCCRPTTAQIGINCTIKYSLILPCVCLSVPFAFVTQERKTVEVQIWSTGSHRANGTRSVTPRSKSQRSRSPGFTERIWHEMHRKWSYYPTSPPAEVIWADLGAALAWFTSYLCQRQQHVSHLLTELATSVGGTARRRLPKQVL